MSEECCDTMGDALKSRVIDSYIFQNEQKWTIGREGYYLKFCPFCGKSLNGMEAITNE